MSIQWTTFNRCVPTGRWSFTGNVEANQTIERDQSFSVNGQVLPQSGLDFGAVDLSNPLTGTDGLLFLGGSSVPLFQVTKYEAFATINTKDVYQLGNGQGMRARLSYLWDLTLHEYVVSDLDRALPVIQALAANQYIEFVLSGQLLVPA